MSQPSYSFWKRNGLSLVLVALFLAFLLAQILTGWAVDNEARMQDGRIPRLDWGALAAEAQAQFEGLMALYPRRTFGHPPVEEIFSSAYPVLRQP